jgi:hypothetical protein
MLPKKGKVFPSQPEAKYAVVIAAALKRELGESHRATKTIMGWTGVNERTAKNWLSGASGPSGDHLVSLVHHSTAVFEAFALMAGRENSIAAMRLVGARDKLLEMLETIIELTATTEGGRDRATPLIKRPL